MAPDMRMDEDRFGADEALVLSAFWSKLRATLAGLPFAEDVVAAWYCAFDPATPRSAKAILLAALAYFILPFDSVSDFIPVLGFTDDAALIAVALRTIAQHLTAAHREAARAALDRLAGRP